MIFERGFEMNYKVGDLAKITGNWNRHWFKIGETVRLKEYCGGMNHAWKAEYLDGRDWWYVCESDMAPVKPATMPQKIVITTDGKTTLARLFDGKAMVKRAEAKCAPSDTFDFGVGTELAVKRLMGDNPATEPANESKPEPVKLYCVKSYNPGKWITKGKTYQLDADGTIHFDDGYYKNFGMIDEDTSVKRNLFYLARRPAKVGEWVYVTGGAGKHAYTTNRIYKVFRVCDDFGEHPNSVFFDNDGRGCVNPSEYFVLDGYRGDSE